MVADRRYRNVTNKLAVFIIPPMPDRITSSHIARPHKVIFSDPFVFVLQNVAGSSYPVSYWYNFILEYSYGLLIMTNVEYNLLQTERRRHIQVPTR